MLDTSKLALLQGVLIGYEHSPVSIFFVLEISMHLDDTDTIFKKKPFVLVFSCLATNLKGGGCLVCLGVGVVRWMSVLCVY